MAPFTRKIEPKAVAVVPTSRNGLSFHFEQMIGHQVQYFEMLLESTSRDHLNLVCYDRKKCSARAQLEIIGDSIFTQKVGKLFKLYGEEKEVQNPDNYGRLVHHHTKRCSGKLEFV